MNELESLSHASVLDAARADVGVTRERVRRGMITKLAFWLLPVMAWTSYRGLTGNPVHPGLPHIDESLYPYLPGVLLIVVVAMGVIIPLTSTGKSPGVIMRPEDIDVGLDDWKGSAVVVDEVVKTLNLFLAHKTFKDSLGGTPRRGVLFEGPPGTGKTHMAKAMAKEAGVPFFFVSASAFQSQYSGMSAKKVRSFFKQLRAAARVEGGAIGFIEEVDAIGISRAKAGGSDAGMAMRGMINELLIQMQSFDEVTRSVRFKNRLIEAVNRWLAPGSRLKRRRSQPANILLIAATNVAGDLDPALLRPGRFDRSIYFDLPSRNGRREIIDYYLGKKSHTSELDDPARRDTLAALTAGYSPVQIEHILDEALVWSLRRGGNALSWPDIQRAKMTEEIGLAQPVEYTEAERRTIATHEAGHAAVAHLVGAGRKLEVLTIVKRRDALGLLAHSDLEERFLKSRSDLEAAIQIAMGGMVAEEQFFGESSTGVSGDLQSATLNAAQMIGSFGMSGTLISLEALGTSDTNIVGKVMGSREGREKLDEMLADAKRKVVAMLDEHAYIVEALRDALLERYELIGDEITEVIKAATPATLVTSIKDAAS